MKKITTVFLILCMALLVVGCGGNSFDKTPGSDSIQVRVTIGAEVFSATLADSETGAAFAELLPLSLEMGDMNGNEKYHYLDDALPVDSYRPGTIKEGDLLLYGNNCVVLFYETFSSSYSYTRIGWIDDTRGLVAALGSGNVTVMFERVESDVQVTPDTPTDPETPDQPTEPDTPEQPGEIEDGEEINVMYLYINGNKLEVTLADNSSVTALVEILMQGDIEYTASEYGGFEMVGNIGHTLPTNHTQIRTEPGDVILYQSNQLVLFYGNNSWSYTRIGKINGYSAAELREYLGAGAGNMQVRLSLG